MMNDSYDYRPILRNITRNCLEHFKPPEPLLPSQWAEQHCRIPAGNALPGPVRFANAPYQVEPLNMTADPNCHRITAMWGAQVGKTQMQLMAIGYFIAHEPSSIMLMQPSQSDFNTFLNAKFDPMVDGTPALSEKVAKPRSRDGVNNQTMKSYPGGFLMGAWSGSPKTMRGRSAPKIICDETDGYERTQEGHPVSLIWQRAATFGDQRLLFETSTPTIKGESHIESSFEAGDKRRWFVPCGDCGHKQYLKWGQVSWQKDESGEHQPETAVYVCEECGCAWDDGARYQAIRKGEWIAEKPFRGHASYHLPELASAFRKLKDIVISFVEKKAMGDLQTFTNVSLAETWETEGAKQDPEALYTRREHYAAPVPNGAVLVTAAVDTQDDRLEIQYEAWGEGQENWKIDFEILRGDLNKPDIWRRLDAALDRRFEHESGVMLDISGTTIDTGGHFTQQVYDYVRQRGYGIFAIKGSSNKDAPLVGRPSKNNLGRINLFQLGTHKLKQQVMQRAGILEPGAGYIHFPVSDQFDKEWFLQFTSEELVTRYVKGVRKEEWRKTRPRNEAFDLSGYNLACLYILNPDFEQLRHEIERQQYKSEEPKSTPTSNSGGGGWLNTSGGSWL
jgi:phage terminase large subunit GpA-like protein